MPSRSDDGFDSSDTLVNHLNPWSLYDELIEGIPYDLKVIDCCIGVNWSYVKSECGTGVAYTCKGGSPRTYKTSFQNASLKEIATLSKSWCFEEASLGIAALNAWYSQSERLGDFETLYDDAAELPDGTIRKMDAFELYREQASGKKVTVVGHFPHVERIAEYAELTVLERNCQDSLDTPDPACEYVLPSQDFVFVTGVALINKTAPRLLALSENARTIMVGPSVIPAPIFFDYGVETLAGSVVADEEKIQHLVKGGSGKMFGEALRMVAVTKRK